MPFEQQEESERDGGRGGIIRFLPVATAAALGILVGLGTFTFGYGEGDAYLTDNPAACANCHVMQAQYDSWTHSSHQRVATCNDCHLPPGFVSPWITKADNGFFHSVAFTTNDFPDPIQIKPRNRRVTQRACLHCHSEFVNHMLPAEANGEVLLCVSCHGDVGHSRR